MGGELVSLLPLQQKQRPQRMPFKRDQLKGELERSFKKYYSKQHLAFPVIVYFCIPCPLTLSGLLYIYFLFLFLLLYSFVHSFSYFQLYFCSLSTLLSSFTGYESLSYLRKVKAKKYCQVYSASSIAVQSPRKILRKKKKKLKIK